MRDNESEPKKLVDRVFSRTAKSSALLFGRRASIYIIAVLFVVVTTLGYVTVRALMGASKSNAVENNAMTTPSNKSIQGSSVTSTSTTSNQPGDLQQNQSQISTNTSTHGASASMQVNGHSIDVPKNGSVSKTFTDDNGTTHVNVSTNSSSTGDSTSSSVTSTSVNSFSQNVSVNGSSATSQ
jgi:hypothetical protein